MRWDTKILPFKTKLEKELDDFLDRPFRYPKDCYFEGLNAEEAALAVSKLIRGGAVVSAAPCGDKLYIIRFHHDQRRINENSGSSAGGVQGQGSQNRDRDLN